MPRMILPLFFMAALAAGWPSDTHAASQKPRVYLGVAEDRGRQADVVIHRIYRLPHDPSTVRRVPRRNASSSHGASTVSGSVKSKSKADTQDAEYRSDHGDDSHAHHHHHHHRRQDHRVIVIIVQPPKEDTPVEGPVRLFGGDRVSLLSAER